MDNANKTKLTKKILVPFQTWGRGPGSNVEGSVRLEPTGYSDDTAEAIARRLERETGLRVCAGPRSEGSSLDGKARLESHHYAITLGYPVSGGGYSPEAEVWFSFAATKGGKP